MCTFYILRNHHHLTAVVIVALVLFLSQRTLPFWNNWLLSSCYLDRYQWRLGAAERTETLLERLFRLFFEVSDETVNSHPF